jgi:hypothetical protein
MRIIQLSLAAALAVHLAAGTALAQESRPERPYRGIFGGAVGSSSGAEESLSLNGSLGGGYDSNVLANATDAGIGTGTGRPTDSRGGGYGLMAGGINYSRSKPSFSFGASANANARYYTTVEDSFVSSYGGSAAASLKPSSRTNVSFGGSVGYQPFSLYSLFPEFQQAPLGYVFLTDLDFNSLQQGYFTYHGDVSVSRQFSSRSTLQAGYSYELSNFAAPYRDFWSHTANIRYTRTISQNLGLRLGYGYSEGYYGNDDTRTIGRHYFDTGVDYKKTLSFSRRTSFSFSTGGTAVTNQDNLSATAIGSATLNHEMGRSWNLYTAYNRDVSFVETFSAPFLYDVVSGGVTGLINRRVEFHSGAGMVFGNYGFGAASSGSDFDTTYGSAGVSMALNRFLSFGMDYSYYHYLFDQDQLLPLGFNEELNRHSVRVTLNAWKPLIQRGRRANAPR